MRYLLAIMALILAGAPALAQAPTPALPPVSGPIEPRVVPKRAEDGMFHQAWAMTTFLDLRDDFAEARQQGRRFAVIFEQRGCIYCTRMHTEVLAQRYINDYVRDNFAILQLDLFGAREVTDFDGTKLSETKLAERWGVMFTPTVVFFHDALPAPVAGKPAWGPALEVTRMSLGFGAATFYDLFVWIRTKTYAQDRNFQRFHVARMAERGQSGVPAE
jgi:hypothetical protein